MQDFINKTTAYSATRKRTSRKIIWFGLFCLFIFGLIFLWPTESRNNPPVENIIIDNPNKQESPEKPEEKITSHTISAGDIPAEVFKEYGKFDVNDTEAIIKAGADVYDFSKLRIGRNIDFIFGAGEKAEKIRYSLDTESIIVVEKNNDDFLVKKDKIPYVTKNEVLSLKIDEFLYKDALDAGLGEASILEIADIFSFDIDFTTEIQPGDELKVLYEKRTLDGNAAPDGKILAAKFVNSGQEYAAYYFEADGIDSHYDGEGHELVRQFLRAPLSYRQITSGYTGARYHPITKKVSAHYQIDYAAASGTPVVATARGTVSSAGFEGGWGKIIRLSHDNGYTTHYGHLSAFAKGVKNGGSVSQGQTIGYVGSTGWSTGPHLDYGMRLNGAPINPLSLKLPKGNPIGGDSMEKFRGIKQEFDEILK